ncbi:MAG TPA: glycosyltransferase family 87 protein [Chloroflexota bacterium]|nr:glycosyltransferase family 87 protein [Chloroflexota bacterium]
MGLLPSTAPALVGQTRHPFSRWFLSQSPVARTARLLIVSLAMVLGLASLSLSPQSLSPPAVYRIDFVQDYVMARAIADGTNPYLPTGDLVERYLGINPGSHFPHPTPHPPTAGLLLLPLTLVGYTTAAAIWFGCELAFLVASVYLVARAEGARVSPWALLATVSALFAWYPVSEDLGSGQLMVLLLVCLTGARLALRSKRSALGGALVGLAILAKPVPWPVLLLFAIRREWRALVSALATIGLGYAAAGLVIGIDRLFFYLTRVLPTVTDGYRAIARNLSLWTVGWRVFDGTRQTVFGGTVLPAIAAPPLFKLTVAAGIVSAALPLALLVAACVVVGKLDRLDAGLGVMICVSILVSPTAWSNYLVLAVIPAAQVIAWLNSHDFPKWETNVAILVGMALFVPLFVWAILAFAIAGEPPPPSLIGSLPFVPALLTLAPSAATTGLAYLMVRLASSRAACLQVNSDGGLR